MKTLDVLTKDLKTSLDKFSKLRRDVLRPHWCSTIRPNDDEYFGEKFGEKVANIDITQR